MRIQVVGAGSWGLALARLLALKGHEVRLWCRQEDGPDRLREQRESPHYLLGIKLPTNVTVDPGEIDPDADIAVLAVPSHIMRVAASAHRFSAATLRVSVAKGIENDTLMRMDEVVREVSGPCPFVALSGPTHAEEVAQDKPASIVAASEDIEAAETVQAAFMSDSFRVYTSTDLVGVELGGSLKNVIAIAAGVCDGFELGDSTKAALITRGLAEIARLGNALGAHPLTFAGLSGMGDLIVTCESRHSRNRALGERLAKGESLDEIQAGTAMVAEGVRTTKSAMALAAKLGVDMPICEQVHRVLFEGTNPRDCVAALMQRDAKPERVG